MIYRPIASRKLWDSWLFPWGNAYHLFYLESHAEKWDHVGHAVSKDLVHWEALPSIHTMGEKGEWNHWGTLTGMVLHREGRFHMFVGSIFDEREVVGMWVSDDLEHWWPYEKNSVMRPTAPYLTERAEAPYWPVDLRDPNIFWREADQRYHAVLFTRNSSWGHGDTGAVLAHATSSDLVEWKFLPPLAHLGKRFFHAEVPDWFEMNGHWYLMFNTLSMGGIKINTPTREDVTGAFYMVSEDFARNFSLPEDPFMIGCGRAMTCCAYSARTIPYDGGRLLYHHVNAARPSWGTPKRVIAHADRTLTLEYLPVLEKLETGILLDSMEAIPAHHKLDLGCWSGEEGRFVGDAGCMGTAYRLATEIKDVHFQIHLNASTAACAGVVLRADGQQGVSVILDFERQRVQIGIAVGRDVMKNLIGDFASWHLKIHDFQLRKLEPNRDYHLRIYVRDVHYEVYLDNQWIFTSVFEDVPLVGNVEVCVERGKAAFKNLRMAILEPLT